MIFDIYRYQLQYKDEIILFVTHKPFHNAYDLVIKKYLKWCKFVHKTLTDDDFMKHLNVVEIPKPNTWPKFSNEMKLQIHWDKKWRNVTKINGIQWRNRGWEYCLENYGHKFDYFPENKIRKFKKGA